MKKMMTLLLAIMMVFALVACGSDKSAETPTKLTDASTQRGNSDESVSEAGNTEPTQAGETKVLVAYFSATGTTRKVAQEIASALGADIYEIVPEVPYTAADLNYNDNKSRSTVEMNDKSARPAISGSVENMDQYSIILLGYPIWWYDAPRIISTFVESYDFSGKTIVPFCTSGSSGISSSEANLEKLTSGVTWLSGDRFSGSSSHAEIVKWLNSLKLDLAIE